MRRTLLLLAILFLATSLAPAQPIKKARFAGSWYPSNPRILNSRLEEYYAAAETSDVNGQILGLITPHAGYGYSGGVAAYAFKALAGRQFDTVILLGPSHKARFGGAAIYPTGFFETPLGDLEVDQAIVGEFSDLTFVELEPRYFSREHCLEMQLPFIVKFLGQVKIVPILLSGTSYSQMGSLADKLVQIAEKYNILIVATSDLTHFLKYDEATRLDQETIGWIEKKDARRLWDSRGQGPSRACGSLPVITLLRYAQARGGKVTTLKYANSGDTIGDKRSVVGYLSAAIHKPGQ